MQRFVPDEKRISRNQDSNSAAYTLRAGAVLVLSSCATSASIRERETNTRGAAQTFTFVACGRETGFHQFRDSNTFLLGDCGHDGNHDVAKDSTVNEVGRDPAEPPREPPQLTPDATDHARARPRLGFRDHKGKRPASSSRALC